MKKLTLSITVLILVLISSCKKEYTFTCYDHFGNADTIRTVEANDSESALQECGENINFGMHASCGID